MALHEAVEAGDLSAVKAGLDAGDDVNGLDGERRTPLIVAAGLGHLELVRLLLERGAEPEWRDATEETALLKAAANGHREVVSVLLPLALSDDDRDLARSFLAAFGQAHGPEVQYDGSSLKRKAVEVAARAADFVGHASPQERVQRVERAEAQGKKKP
jgi:ankyrin repeat protein